MNDRNITYKGGYKYQLREDYHIATAIRPAVAYDKVGNYMRLDLEGNLTVLKGYAWDGPSGGVPDTARSMRASLVHDAFYQLLREKVLDPSAKDATDRLFKQMCIEDGMFGPFAHILYLGLKAFAGFAADPANDRRLKMAPGV